MFVYEKKLQYPVKIKSTNPKLASLIISQYGGPDLNRLSSFPTSQEGPEQPPVLLLFLIPTGYSSRSSPG